MPEQAATPKKRQAKPGTRRVTITLPEAEYNALAKLAESQMREPNNMLSFMLRGKMVGLMREYAAPGGGPRLVS